MRLIDADALMEKLTLLQKKWKDNCGKDIDAFNCVAAINAMPTVDAVQIVRCGQCKFFRTEKCTSRDDGWYCADGERKDDGR